MSFKPLKITAFDNNDIGIISGLVQDSIVELKDINYDGSTLTIAMKRFAWEVANQPVDKNITDKQLYIRTYSVLRFDNVVKLSKNDILRDSDLDILMLMSIHILKSDTNINVYFNFSGGMTLKAEVLNIASILCDVGDSWTTDVMPSHNDHLLS